MASQSVTILVVDDEAVVHEILSEALAHPERRLLSATTCAQALAMARENQFELALVDKNLPDGSGLDLAREMRQMRPGAEVVLITAYPSLDSAMEAVRIGAFDYVAKPFDDIEKLALMVQNALDKVRLKRERQDLLHELKESEERYALAVRGANDGLWDWNLVTGDVYFSPRWKSMLGFGESEIGSACEEWLGRIHEEERERVRALLKAHIEGEVPYFEDEHRVQHHDGTYRWMLNRGLAIRDQGGKAVRMAGSQTDMSARRMAEQKMRHDALHDRVTGLANRSLFLDRVGQSLTRSRRRGSHHFAVILLDLDRFKIVNESLGHPVGDELLVATARRLEGCLRAQDSAARLGGDEFAVLLEDIKSSEDAIRVAERIQSRLGEPLRLFGRDVFTTSSIGIAVGRSTYQRAEDLVRDADIAMYRAKSLGRARHVVFDPSMQVQATALLELDSALRRAIERDEFCLHFQPIVSLESGHIIGFEALVRWQHPERGLVAPGDFIPVAEDTGLIMPLSRLVLTKACRQARLWLDQGGPSDLYMSVNVSGKHLVSSGLADEVKGILTASCLPPQNLRLEITESVIVQDTDAAAA
ncbi:MAG: diguanylate cyclase, partial [Deltaproteobacteria bacterium]|nr:diguanylate cyclase [Deltaproteobacteria bacterium]